MNLDSGFLDRRIEIVHNHFLEFLVPFNQGTIHLQQTTHYKIRYFKNISIQKSTNPLNKQMHFTTHRDRVLVGGGDQLRGVRHSLDLGGEV